MGLQGHLITDRIALSKYKRVKWADHYCALCVDIMPSKCMQAATASAMCVLSYCRMFVVACIYVYYNMSRLHKTLWAIPSLRTLHSEEIDNFNKEINILMKAVDSL